MAELVSGMCRRSVASIRVALVLVSVALMGCQAYDDDEVELPAADFDRFVTEIQPVLAKRCANPSCHGNLSRPFEVYAPHFHRFDPEDVYLDSSLSDQELWWNYQSVVAFILDLERAEESLLLIKPLAEAEGGSNHGGPAVFSDREGYEYTTLASWIQDALR